MVFIEGIGIVVLILVVGAGVAVALNWKTLQRDRRIQKEGQDVIAWIANVDPALFEKPAGDADIAGPAGVLIPTDSRDADDEEFMMGLVGRVHELMKRKAAPEEKALARELKNPDYREGVWVELPEAWTDGATVVYTLIEVYRANLPKKRLKWRYVRCKAILDEPEAGVLHLEYHPNDEPDLPYVRRKKRAARDDD
jgi:hypothetical protein